MTVPRLEAVAGRWQKVPPLSVSVATVAAALGVKFEPPKDKAEGLAELADMVGAVPGFKMEKPAWLQAATTST